MVEKSFVYFNNILAGTLMKKEDEYIFTYYQQYIDDPRNPSISFTLPKTKQIYSSPTLFPFFAGLLSQGANRRIQEREEVGDFELLLRTAGTDTIGAITVKPA